MNLQENFLYKLKQLSYEFIKSLLIWKLYGFKVFKKSINSFFSTTPYNEINNNKNVYLIENKLRLGVTCKNKEKLVKLYNEGIKQGELFLKKLTKD